MHLSLADSRGLVRGLSLGLAPLLVAGCLDEGGPTSSSVERVTPSAEAIAELSDHEGFSRATGALEAETAPMMDEAALEVCADAGNLCLDGGQDVLTCIDGYVDCVVAAGLPSDHPYLVCLETLVSCWSTAGDDEGAVNTCFVAYDSCLGEDLPEASPPPTTEPEPGDPSDQDAALLACEDEASACLASAMDDADTAVCTGGYRDCIVAVGVSPEEPYVVCLDEATACLTDGSGPCWDQFDACVDAAYPYDGGNGSGGHEPGEPDDYEPALCEDPVVTCYEDGGSNVACIGAYRTCLLAEGWRVDDAEIICLDTLIACAGPAEASADPDAALEACADEFNICLGYPGY